MEGIDKEGAEIAAVLFNRMTLEQKLSASEDFAKRVTAFMQDNGYRMVFNRWYLQAKPKSPTTTQTT